MSCGAGHRRGLDPTLLWLWRRPAATAPIRPLSWDLHMPRERPQKRQKKKKSEGWEFPGGLVVKDSALSLLWIGFNPWPRELPQAAGAPPKKKEKRKKKQSQGSKFCAGFDIYQLCDLGQAIFLLYIFLCKNEGVESDFQSPFQL